jgi:polysaccharide pyruvyl transferase CsaB
VSTSTGVPAAAGRQDRRGPAQLTDATRRPRIAGSRPAIGICGSYGGLNVGDEAILTVALEQLRREVPGVELTVFTRNCEHTRQHHDVERCIDARSALRDELTAEIERLDLLLLGGGGILYDREAEYYLHLPRIAQARGVRTATYAIGAGPLERRGERSAVADVLNGMARITVRDVRDRRLLEEIGVDREIVVTADPALLLEPVPRSSALDREGIRSGRRLVGMSVREPGGAAADVEDGVYHSLLAHAGDYAAERFDADVVFIPMERRDVKEAHRVISEMGLPDRASVLKANVGPREMLDLISQLDMAIGMRLHFIIFAALSGLPVLALPYAPKVTSFLDRIGLPTPRLVEREHAGVLLAAIDRTWDLRHERGRTVPGEIAAMQQDSRRTPGLIAELLPADIPHACARAS